MHKTTRRFWNIPFYLAHFLCFVAMAKRSPIWGYFTVNKDAHYEVCNVCQISISRGGKNMKTFNMTNLVQHLKSKHIDEFKKYQRAQGRKTAE